MEGGGGGGSTSTARKQCATSRIIAVRGGEGFIGELKKCGVQRKQKRASVSAQPRRMHVSPLPVPPVRFGGPMASPPKPMNDPQLQRPQNTSQPLARQRSTSFPNVCINPCRPGPPRTYRQAPSTTQLDAGPRCNASGRQLRRRAGWPQIGNLASSCRSDVKLLGQHQGQRLRLRALGADLALERRLQRARQGSPAGVGPRARAALRLSTGTQTPKKGLHKLQIANCNISVNFLPTCP